ncbi:unnamed protein product [Miscanthus lutarioriparius]|uniref:Zinc finger LSD1-type domain-containing protein n=1 Tax=Miscanthus lutarioriparius TaxID=422564 RepID=A0A811R9Y3_9POAL|nr:unnamed protein product [Miscanthus lutarioriparius]
MEMARLICGGCQTLLIYTAVQQLLYEDIIYIINLSSHSIFVHSAVSSIAHVNCGQCQTVLMYPYGAPSVKCAICNFITNVGGVTPVRPLPPALPASSGNSYSIPSTSVPRNQSQNVTVVVENPMTVDDKGKLVSNVVVGVTSGGKSNMSQPV